MKIKLGYEVKCIVSGFTGIATAKIEYLTGCVQFEVSPMILKSDGDMQSAYWVDESRLKYISKGLKKPKKKKLKKKKATRVRGGAIMESITSRGDSVTRKPSHSVTKS